MQTETVAQYIRWAQEVLQTESCALQEISDGLGIWIIGQSGFRGCHARSCNNLLHPYIAQTFWMYCHVWFHFELVICRY